MADSIPQLKADINALQKRLAVALGRVAELEAMPPKVVVEKVPFETVKVEYRDRIIEVPVDRIVEVPVEIPVERVVHVDRVVEVPVKDATATRRADALASELLAAKAEILDLKSKLATERKKKPKAAEVKEVKVKVPMPAETRVEYRDRDVVRVVDRVVEVPVEVIRTERVDNPAHMAEVARIAAELDAMRRALDLERQKPPVIETVAIPVDRPVAMPSEVRIEYRDREIERVVYRDNPEHVKTIRKLQSRLRGK